MIESMIAGLLIIWLIAAWKPGLEAISARFGIPPAPAAPPNGLAPAPAANGLAPPNGLAPRGFAAGGGGAAAAGLGAG